MKKTTKAIISLVLVALLAVSFAGCKKVNYVTNGTIQAIKEVKDGSWEKGGHAASAAADGADASADGAASTIEAFKADTYGGVEMKTEEDALKYFISAYDKTKSKTAEYINSEGQKEVWYEFLGEEDLKIKSVLIEGKSNGMIDSLVPTIVGGLFSKGIWGLPPCANRNPEMDVDEENKSLQTNRLTIEDIQGINVKDNGDGTITMVIQPTEVNMSHKGMDSQGKVFNTLGAIDSVVDSIDILSWSEGTTADNCKVNYKEGTATFKIDTKSGEIVEADYLMLVQVQVSHACIKVIKDKNAEVSIEYTNHFPASDQYLMDTKGAKRA